MSALAERLARSLPATSFELETLVRLVGIVETTDTPSAAVTCAGRARLLVNPEFVGRYCRHDEYLFLLVMHEMWHVLLGHTTLYRRPTLAHNIAFDALINAGLARQHPGAEYRGFFEALNPPDVFPGLLLRAPVGWPSNPQYKVPGPRGTKEMLQRLYPPPGQTAPEPTYDELLALIERARGADLATAVLVGDHDDETSDSADGQSSSSGTPREERGDPMDDELFGDVVREIVAKWPPPPVVLAGRDAGGNLHNNWIEPRPNTAVLRREFAKVIAEVLQPDRAGAVEQRREYRPTIVGPGPLPNPKDRLLPAKRRLHSGLVLPNQEVILPTRNATTPQRALVYLDVSGSMQQILPALVDLLAAPARRGLVRVRQFSTKVEPISVEDLVAGRLTTTGGTDISCVLDDIAAQAVNRVMVVTDGYVGAAPESMLRPLLERGVAFTAVLPTGGWVRDLAQYATVHHLSRLEFT